MQTLSIERIKLTHFRAAGTIPRPTAQDRERLRTVGFVDPIVVRPAVTGGDFEVISNVVDLLAAGELQIPQVPVVIRDDFDDAEAMAAIHARYLQAAVNPIDEARWFADCLASGRARGNYSIAKLGRSTGKSRTHVSKSLSLLKLPNIVQEALKCGQLSVGHGHVLATLSAEDAEHFARLVIGESLSVKGLRRRIAGTGQGAKRAEPASRDVDVERVQSLLSDLLGCPSAIMLHRPEVILTVNYFNNSEILNGLTDRFQPTGASAIVDFSQGVVTLQFASIDTFNEFLARVGYQDS